VVKVNLKNSLEIENMRRSGEILTTVLDRLVDAARPGKKITELDKMAGELTRKMGGQPAFLNYQGFPANLCVSLNNEIVHAIPTDRKLNYGDLVGIDYGVSYNGMITDAARTISIGKPSEDAQRLLTGCYEALQTAIEIVRDGVHVGDIGAAIEKKLNDYGLKVIYSLTGHGVGYELHEDPVIANYGQAGTGDVLKAGMTIAIEPIAAIGTHDLYLADDGWTYMTRDGSLSAQFENTLLVTKDGCEILAS
jgi:methionyl aminopeptidase